MNRDDTNKLYGVGWNSDHAAVFYDCKNPECEPVCMDDCRSCLEKRVKIHIINLVAETELIK